MDFEAATVLQVYYSVVTAWLNMWLGRNHEWQMVRVSVALTVFNLLGAILWFVFVYLGTHS